MFYLGLISLMFTTSTNAQQLTVVAAENFKPYNYLDGGIVKGMSAEVVRVTLAKAGIEAEFHVYPWPRAYKMALEGINILIYTTVRTAGREESFHWVKAPHSSSF